jgi:ATP-binding cassette, subfamily B, bacterial
MGCSAMSGDPSTMRRVVALFGPYWGRLIVLGLVVVLTAVGGVGNLLLIKPVFDQALFCPRGCPNLPLLFWLVGAMIAIPVVVGVLGIGQPYLANVVGQRVMRDVREALYVHLQRMPLRFFTETKTGEIQSCLANDVGGVQQVLTETGSLILMDIVVLLSTVGAMVMLSWQLAVLSLALMPLFAGLADRVGRARRTVGSSTQETMAELSTLAEETLSVCISTTSAPTQHPTARTAIDLPNEPAPGNKDDERAVITGALQPVP